MNKQDQLNMSLPVYITHVDTACVLIEIGEFRILTDPVFDSPGKLYHFGFGTFSRKKSKPALSREEIGRVDLVLLSHDQHQDNLDESGRDFLQTVPMTISTLPASKRLPNVHGLKDWETILVETPHLKNFKITAVPAQHSYFKFLSPLAGKVNGFILEWSGQSDGVFYISGDTVLFSGINEIAKRFPKINQALLHLGAVKFPYLSGPIRYTFDSSEAITAIKLLRPKHVLPIHCEGWQHFREPIEHAKATLENARLDTRISWPSPGIREAL